MAAVSKTRFVIKTINKISPAGLARFGGDKYTITPSRRTRDRAPIMLRSHKMQDSDVPLTTRAIARYGVTHHLLSAELIGKLKPGRSILNFARGELVDEAALAALRRRRRRPLHLRLRRRARALARRASCRSRTSASAEEAEENAASMAADTIQLFLETGTIRDSVNFPACALPRAWIRERVCVVTENKPGMLGELMSVFGEGGLNILQQVNMSRGDIAYNVIDLEIETILSIEGVKSTRFINDWCPGSGFAIKYQDRIIGIGVDAPEQKSYAEMTRPATECDAPPALASPAAGRFFGAKRKGSAAGAGCAATTRTRAFGAGRSASGQRDGRSAPISSAASAAAR
ncbi:phosphoglycerate dehydrogenase [Aureococcus anophagefferens]|nr:phosphoglycerate dehydrogenase [Aureococcus anophagefferens]